MKWFNWLFIIVLICLLFIAIPIPFAGSRSKQQLSFMFDDYITKFNKTYKDDPSEYQMRFQHFVASVQEIDRLNSESRGPEGHRAHYGLTRLSDMSKDEYKDLHLSDERMTKSPQSYGRHWSRREQDKSWYRPSLVVLWGCSPSKGYEINDQPPKDSNVDIKNISRTKRAALPMTMDWRTKGVVGPVRDQGLCGACWAFSTVGAMESMAAITTGKLDPLSVQEVIDCAGLGNSGCAGGDICLLLDWLTLTKAAVVPERAYPLRLTDGKCRLLTPSNATGVKVKAFTCDDLSGAEEKILQALATHGPVAVAVNALTWQNYLGGVIQYHCGGAPSELNHAVLLVGYDLTSEVPHYIAKNSWGGDFGIGGYLRLAVGTNVCGLANEVASVEVQ